MMMMATKSFPLLSILFCLVSSNHNGIIAAAENKNKNPSPKVKGMFVFGSSLVDNGNNNFLPNSLAKANFLPYGIDFPLGPSGRFSNGKNVIDLLGELLQIPSYIPPFADPTTKGKRTLFGVNFASGASGILDDTGELAGSVFTLNQQIENFEKVTLPDLEKRLQGAVKTREYLKEFLFVVGTGGNDYSFNYFITKVGSNVSVEAFTQNLTSALSHQLKRLYRLGGRKFVVVSVNPNGCIPFARSFYPKRKGCVESINRAVQLFNTNLRSMANTANLDIHMPASNMVFVNSYKIITDILKSPSSTGFTDSEHSCCETERIGGGGGGIFCKRGGTTCSNRSSNVYFDGLHPSEAVNVVIANKAFNSNRRQEVYPINVKQLAEM